jgi:hypothetical protein
MDIDHKHVYELRMDRRLNVDIYKYVRSSN